MLLPGLLGGLGGGQFGDAVFSNEAFDRVMSQLMDQNAGGNAPGPAPAEAIASLPKKKIDTSMLGDNGKADCSICMDSVQIGDEVTELYCRHWFHTECVSSWLNAHDTCPHCRKGIEAARLESATHAAPGHMSDKSPTGQTGSSSGGADTRPDISETSQNVPSGGTTASDHSHPPNPSETSSKESGQATGSSNSVNNSTTRGAFPPRLSSPSSRARAAGIFRPRSAATSADSIPSRHYSQMDQPESPPRTRRAPIRQGDPGADERSGEQPAGRRRSSGNEGFAERVRNLFGSRQN
jgi:hypothetical protein